MRAFTALLVIAAPVPQTAQASFRLRTCASAPSESSGP
jgi:hypothetical protein